MSAEGWILLVGLRVLDLGLLAAWLVWFFRLRDSDDDDPLDDDGPGGDGPNPGPGDRGPRGPGLRLPAAKRRIRDHLPPPSWRPRRGGRPAPAPLPARVRRPGAPLPARVRPGAPLAAPRRSPLTI